MTMQKSICKPCRWCVNRCVRHFVNCRIKESQSVLVDQLLPEFQVVGTILQYKKPSQVAWTDLVDLSIITSTLDLTASANTTTLPVGSQATTTVEIT